MNDTPVPVAAQDTQQDPRETGTETDQATTCLSDLAMGTEVVEQ